MSSEEKKILKKLKNSYKINKKYYAFLADYLFKIGYDQQAQNILEENNDKYPDYTSGKLVLGEIFYGRKEYLKAEDFFKQVLALNKKSVKALKYLANIESLRKNKQAQFDYLSDVMRYDPFDQDAKNFILMYSGVYSDENVAGSSYFSERMSELIDTDIVKQAIEGSNTYKSTYDLEELSRIALEEKEKMEKETKSEKDETIELERKISELTLEEKEHNKNTKLEDSYEDIDLVHEIDTSQRDFSKTSELKESNDPAPSIEIERDESDEFEISFSEESPISEKVLEDFEKELDDFKTVSNFDIPVPDEISEIFGSNEEVEDSRQFDDELNRIPMKEFFSTANKNVRTMEKFARLSEKAPDNIDFKKEFSVARSLFIKERLNNEIDYYKFLSKKYPNNPKYASKLKSFTEIYDASDDYHLK